MLRINLLPPYIYDKQKKVQVFAVWARSRAKPNSSAAGVAAVFRVVVFFDRVAVVLMVASLFGEC